jgi:long-chain acyl-CoA synthetase
MAATSDDEKLTVEGIPDEKVQAMRALFAPFDSDDEVTVEQLEAIFKAIGKEVPRPALEAMRAVVEAEKNLSAAERRFAKDHVQSEPAAVRVEGKSIRRALGYADAPLLDKPETVGGRKLSTLHEVFEYGAAQFGNVDGMGVRQVTEDGTLAGEYSYETWAEIHVQVNEFRAGLVALAGVGQGGRVGLAMRTRGEWWKAYMALCSMSATGVTLYDTFGAESLQYIANLTELSVIVAGAPQLPTLAAILADVPSVRHIVAVVDANERAAAAEHIAAIEALRQGDDAIRVHLFEAVLEAGRAAPIDATPPSADDLALICFTSGTTSWPKGVTHTHSAMVATLAANVLPDLVSGVDKTLALLPLAHIMEIFAHSFVILKGCTIAYYSGDPRKLSEDASFANPTVFIGVPRLLNRIYSSVMASIRSKVGMPRLIVELALRSKRAQLRRTGRLRSYWDWIAFEQVRAVLGGRIRFLATGSAPIDAEVLDFYRVCFGTAIVEGYGASEVWIASTTSSKDLDTPGTVGPPMPFVEMALRDVPAMDYLTTDQPSPRGEIIIRGPTVMRGYYKQDELTAEAIDADGWYGTGDVGSWQPNGTMKIIDRVKELFKLAQGEYVSPNKIENILVLAKLAAQVYVHGESLRSSLVAIVVPDPETLPSFDKPDDPQAIAAALLKEFGELATQYKLPGYERIRAVHVHFEPFSVDNGLMTPTFKLKRYNARKHFADVIEKLYVGLD